MPLRFSTAAEDLRVAQTHLRGLEDSLHERANIQSPEWKVYLGWIQAYDTALAEQSAIEDELTQTGELRLEAGRSYSLELESYCVHGGTARPVVGDGMRVAPLSGPAKSWLPTLLESQGSKRVSQERVQYLIWALLYDSRFDELSEEDQSTLLTFFPDAATRFGSRRLESAMSRVIPELIPKEVSDTLKIATSLRNQVLALHDDFSELEKKLAPISGRKSPIPVGWLKMDEGYLLRVTSEGYSKIRIDISVPQTNGREPYSTRRLVFRPSEWIALPAQGQRLAISNRPAARGPAGPKYNACKGYQSWKPKDCRELTLADRAALMTLVDPSRFSRTRYRAPPKTGAKTEDETDCSHFVNDMMKKIGFSYPYAPTRDMGCLNVFKTIPESEARAGDLILSPGHMGLIDDNGRVVSATQGGRYKRSRLDPKDPNFIPSITRLDKSEAGIKPWKILRWSCP